MGLTILLRKITVIPRCGSIKILPQQRGFVCAGDDGILSVVETLEVDASSDLRTVTTVLTGHRGFVTECDTLSCGQAILSSR